MTLDFCYADINERLHDSSNSIDVTCIAPERSIFLLEHVVEPLKLEPDYEVFRPMIDATWVALCLGQLYSVREVEVMLIADCKVSVP